jgi:hypothetical protein
MGKSFWFECEKCGYRATVSGGEDRGWMLQVRTISCQDCRQLHDAVVRLRVPDEARRSLYNATGLVKPAPLARPRIPQRPPSFQAAVSSLPVRPARLQRWLRFPLQCPVSALHRVKPWTDPGGCPRCGLPLEKNAIPFRIWD